MTTPCAPVVLLGYRRPEHTQQVFDAIRHARPPVLLVVMDGARADDPDDTTLVEATRKVVEDVDWECEVHRIYAEENLGLKSRVASGLDEVFRIVDAAIILEDDCVPSPSFFSYASELLGRYAADERVGIVSGTQRLGAKWAGDSSYLFSKDVRIWGWATWGRTWRAFRDSGELDATWTRSEAQTLGIMFAPGPRRRSMVSMMSKSHLLDSWALPFAVHCVTRGYLNPIPRVNLIRNIGLGNGSTHTGFENYVVDVPVSQLSLPLTHPESVAYTEPVDEWESSRDMEEFFTYPLRHPVDTGRRLWRFGRSLLARLFQTHPL